MECILLHNHLDVIHFVRSHEMLLPGFYRQFSTFVNTNLQECYDSVSLPSGVDISWWSSILSQDTSLDQLSSPGMHWTVAQLASAVVKRAISTSRVNTGLKFWLDTIQTCHKNLNEICLCCWHLPLAMHIHM
jgi:hypothetical protein